MISMAYEAKPAVPGTDTLSAGDGPSFRLILVPVRLAGEAAQSTAVAARPPRGHWRAAWGHGLPATAVLADAPRSGVASAIASQASARPGDMIMMARRPNSAISRLVLASVPDQVMRRATCPVPAVHPRPKTTRHVGH
jgi:Tfp pilus assembly protein FimV